MNNLELGYYPIADGYGYFLDSAPQEVLNELKVQIDEIQNNFDNGKKVNERLIGEIQHEYGIKPQPLTTQYIKGLCQHFDNISEHVKVHYKYRPNLKFNDLWVNFQQKYEYNPIHDHSGVFSFVIWYQIPYKFEDERKYSYKNLDRDCSHGVFSFVTPNVFSRQSNFTLHRLDIDKSKEGYVAIFPSSLNHVVYPFYSSDEYRITVAGNIEVVN